MDLWSMLEERVKQQDLRVKERLELLERMKAGHKPGKISIEDRMDEIGASSKGGGRPPEGSNGRMKPIAVEITRFRGWRIRRRISLKAPITLIAGDNGRGKSSLLNSIEWCLYGAEVARKGSGIEERQDWELRTRTEKADTDPTRVELELDTAEGPFKVCRGRGAAATAREPDTLTIHCPDGAILTDEVAASWLNKSGIPDWKTYRRAHCFHQEAARQRVVRTSERSAILAALLGLDEEIALRNTLESYKPSNLFTEIDRTLEELNGEAQRALELPQRRLTDLERQGAEIGLDSSQLNESTAHALRSKLVDQARELSNRLGLTTDFPDESDPAAIRHWAPTWPAIARSVSPALSALENYRPRHAQIDRHIANYEADYRAWRQAQSELERERQTGGDQEQREATVNRTKATLTATTLALQHSHAMVKLWVDAKAVIEAAGRNDDCPVCQTRVSGLAERLDVAIDRMRSDEFQALQSAERAARVALEKARLDQETLQELVNEEARARRRVDHQHARLEQALGMDESTAVHDVLAEARKRREALGAEISGLEGLASERDLSIQDHPAECLRLDVLEKWLSASERAKSRFDLPAMPEWSEFNEALDDLAAFGGDLEFLGGLAREIQAERSHVRAAEVNKALGKYYSLITQDDRAIQVRVHATAQRISYHLVDGSDRLAVPVLNQAGINALSLAFLFAQSEARAGAGSWSLVALDDPAQSLDAGKQKGLSQAIEELANSCSVLVATVPGQLSDRLEDYVSRQRRIVRLGPWSPTDGATIESEVDL